jgi:hypothetical protein
MGMQVSFHFSVALRHANESNYPAKPASQQGRHARVSCTYVELAECPMTTLRADSQLLERWQGWGNLLLQFLLSKNRNLSQSNREFVLTRLKLAFHSPT